MTKDEKRIELAKVLFHMLPSNAMNNCANTFMVYSVRLSDGDLSSQTGRINPADFTNLSFGKFGIRMSLASRRTFRMLHAICDCCFNIATSFSLPVIHIILVCSKKQMGWIHTFPIVAVMKDAYSMIGVAIRNRAVMKLPRKTVGGNHLEIVEKPIAAASYRAKPIPATRRAAFINHGPKSFISGLERRLGTWQTILSNIHNLLWILLAVPGARYIGDGDFILPNPETNQS